MWSFWLHYVVAVAHVTKMFQLRIEIKAWIINHRQSILLDLIIHPYPDTISVGNGWTAVEIKNVICLISFQLNTLISWPYIMEFKIIWQ